MSKSFGEVMKEKLDELKANSSHPLSDEDEATFTYLYWIADQIEEELDTWYKRYDMADKAIKTIRVELDKITIWGDQGRQKETCLQEVNQIVKTYDKAYDAYATKYADKLRSRKEPA